MENLEALSDQELRVRLQQYGFANLPVTDTTRKVLVKKLRLAIEGETTKQRRETVAVAKFSSDEEPEKEEPAKRVKTPNRRATVASEKAKPANGQTNGNGNLTTAESSSKSSSRHSSRATPSKEPSKPPVAPLYPSLQEDSDDDVIEIPLPPRRSRTPSMGKSETVRTSYKTTFEVPESHVEETLEVDDEFEAPPPRNPSPMLTKTVHRKTFTTSTSGYSSKLPESSASSALSRKTMTTSYNPRGNYKYAEEKEEDDDKFDLDESDTPYLSNFAKRLSTLRAEPLDAGMEKYKSIADIVPPTADYKSSYKPVSYGYRTSAPAPRPAVRKSGFVKELGRIYDDLDRQYNFRTILWIIFVIMLIVAILVIFM